MTLFDTATRYSAVGMIALATISESAIAQEKPTGFFESIFNWKSATPEDQQRRLSELGTQAAETAAEYDGGIVGVITNKTVGVPLKSGAVQLRKRLDENHSYYERLIKATETGNLDSEAIARADEEQRQLIQRNQEPVRLQDPTSDVIEAALRALAKLGRRAGVSVEYAIGTINAMYDENNDRKQENVGPMNMPEPEYVTPTTPEKRVYETKPEGFDQPSTQADCPDMEWYARRCNRDGEVLPEPVATPPSSWRIASVIRSDGLQVPISPNDACRPFKSLDEVATGYASGYGPHTLDGCTNRISNINDHNKVVTYNCSFLQKRVTGTVEIFGNDSTMRVIITENNGYTGTQSIIETHYARCDQ